MEDSKNELLKFIVGNYNVSCDISLVKINALEQYPHIFKIECPNFNLIVKQIKKSKIFCKNIDKLYLDLSSINYVQIPMLTIYGKYSFSIGDKIFLVYNELLETSKNPSPIWWSECLSKIHNINFSENYMNSFSKDLYNQTINLFLVAQKYIDDNKMNKIYKLLESVDINIIDDNKLVTLCHNDPYNFNVMCLENEYKLIDTDGMGLSPREYDIQKLMYNYVINSNDIESVISFWEKFKTNYERESVVKINVELMKNIYKLDLIRSLSWLYVVSNDLTRLDQKRQIEQLIIYEKSIENDSHIKVLKNI